MIWHLNIKGGKRNNKSSKYLEMQKSSPPKKPLTAFFMFREKEKEKGVTMGGKEAGEKWKALSESQKKPYVDAYKKAKDKYDKYLEEVEGIAPRSSSKKVEKPTCFRTGRIRAVCGHRKDIKQMSQQTYSALGRVLVLRWSLNFLGGVYARPRQDGLRRDEG